MLQLLLLTKLQVQEIRLLNFKQNTNKNQSSPRLCSTLKGFVFLIYQYEWICKWIQNCYHYYRRKALWDSKTYIKHCLIVLLLCIINVNYKLWSKPPPSETVSRILYKFTCWQPYRISNPGFIYLFIYLLSNWDLDCSQALYE